MSAFLLYHRKTRPTGRLLAAELGIPGGVEVRGNPDVVIRWGNQRGSYPGSFNTPVSMALASDKLAAFTRWQAEGVRIPEFGTEPGDWDTYFGRMRHGFGGRDIIILPTGMGDTYADVDFYTRYIPSEREYRIHVFDQQIIRVQRKYLDFPEEDRHRGRIKNYANGYRFRTPQRQLHSDRLDQAKRAVSTLGLVWGAVDLIIGGDNEAYVLEVNTAPKLAPLTCTQYATAMRVYMRENFEEMGADE